MKILTKLILCILISFTSLLWAQEVDRAQLARGFNFIQTKVYSAAADAKILKLFEGLRVADVSDGMDMVGLPGTGLVDPAIHSDWVDTENLAHQFRGIAVTARLSDRTDRNRARILTNGKAISTMPIPMRRLPN